MPSRPLSPAAARTLYNVADAVLPPSDGCVGFDWAPGVEAALGRRGERAARRLRALLWRLEWTPWLRGHAPFSQLPRSERAALLDAWARRPRRAADHALLCALLAEAHAAASSRPSQSSGA